MAGKISRRDFLKRSSIAAGATAATFTPLSSTLAKEKPTSQVIVIKDERSATKSSNTVTVHEEYIPDMVDHAVMRLTDKLDRVEAYEALFPNGVSDTTTVAIKKNGVSAPSSKSWNYVYQAFKDGLMDCGIKESNITVSTGRQRPGSIGSSNPRFTVGRYEYAVQDLWHESDYIINMPVCWGHSTSHGITMGLKNMMSATSQMGTSSWTVSRYHGYEKDPDEPWESLVNVQFKDKAVLFLMDAVTCRSDGGPGGSANVAGGQIIASRDIVACDRVGLELLVDNGLSSSRTSSAKTILGLAAKSPYNLGNDQLDDIEILTWDMTGINKNQSMPQGNFQIVTRTMGRKVEFKVLGASSNSVKLEIYTVKGKRIWSRENLSANNVVWHGLDTNRNRVSQGIYLYKLKSGNKIGKGDIRISE
jgi:hypothetical protein